MAEIVSTAPESLNLASIPGFEALHPDLQEGLHRLDFDESHRELVGKIVKVGELTTRYLDEAGDGLMSEDRVAEIYELQNILFTNEDLKALAIPLFGSQHLDEYGQLDKDTWFWKLVNPLGGVPHIDQANSAMGDILAAEWSPSEKRSILEFGKGGGKTILSVMKKLVDKDISLRDLSYSGIEIAPSLVEHSKRLFDPNSECPSYIEGDEGLERAYGWQKLAFALLGEKQVLQGDISEHLPQVAEESQDAVLLSYVIHHLKCGEAFIRAVINRRLIVENNEAYYCPSNRERIRLDNVEVATNVIRFLKVNYSSEKLADFLGGEEIEGFENELREMVVNNQLDALKEIWKKLKPGGHVFVADPAEGKSNFNRAVIIKDAEGFADFTSAEQMEQMLVRAGFEDVRVVSQWEIDKDYFERNKEAFEGFEPQIKSFDGGETVLAYILAVPAERVEEIINQHGEGIVDPYLGYLVSAKKPSDISSSVIEGARKAVKDNL